MPNEKEPHHWRLMFPSEYIGAWDLEGKEFTVTIAKVAFEDLVLKGGAKERKPVVTFQNAKKRLVLNKTNAETISFMHGTDPTKWVGKKVTLYPTTTKFGRDTVDCIRIKDTR